MPLRRRDVLLAAAAAVAAPAGADELRQLRVLCVPTDGAKSVLYAQRSGLFRRHGINAEVGALGSGAAIFAAVLGGAAEIGSGSLFPVFAAFARGVPLRIVAPASLYQSDHADSLLLVQKDGPLRAPRNLNGKTIGVDAVRDVYSTATVAWVDLNGGDGKSLRPLELKPGEQISALDTGRIDAAVLKTPFVTTALDSGRFRVLGKPLDAIAPRFLLSCWVATADFVSKSPEVVSGFVDSMRAAARYTNANQAATVELVGAFTGQEPAVIAHGIRSITAETITAADLQKPLDFAVKYGIVERPFELSGLLAPSVVLSRSR